MSRLVGLRILAYVAWAAFALGVVAAFMRAHLPHWGLFAGGLLLVVGLGLVAAGELTRWAAKRYMPQPGRFALRVWLISSALWALYVAVVSLPIAFFTSLPATEAGGRVLGLVTFLPLAGLWIGVWRMMYVRARPRLGRR